MAQSCSNAAYRVALAAMSELHVTWDHYHDLIETLAVQIYESGWEFNQIVCIAKGGVRIGDLLCRIYDVPLAILSTASYRGKNNQQRGKLVFSKDLTMTTANLGDRVLLVDDLVDSGATLDRSIQWLRHYYGFYIDEIRTAVLWQKACSSAKPDYYGQYLADNPWIHQPTAKYEQMSITDLVASRKAAESV